MNLEISLLRSFDDTIVAEVRAMPGVLVAAHRARAAIRAIQALALRVLAERIELGELDPIDLTINFSLDAPSQLLVIQDDAMAQIDEAVSYDVLEEVAKRIFDPIQNAMAGVHGVVDKALDRPRPQSRLSLDVLVQLEAVGWREHRRAPSHRILCNSQGEQLVFPFREDDVLRNELLHRFLTLGGGTV